MNPRTPDFDELLGSDVPAAERERLRNAHDLLVRAGPPPELSPGLDPVPWPDEALAPIGLQRRRTHRGRSWLVVASAAAAIALVAYVIGHGTGSNSNSFEVLATKHMHGTTLAPRASGTIEVGARGTDGNWPMLVDVVNLPPVPDDGYYQLWLSRDRKPVSLCGSFNTRRGFETIVRLSAAYSFKRVNGWIVTREIPGVRRQLVMAT
jgi:Anti-sigma-K factor rskA